MNVMSYGVQVRCDCGHLLCLAPGECLEQPLAEVAVCNAMGEMRVQRAIRGEYPICGQCERIRSGELRPATPADWPNAHPNDAAERARTHLVDCSDGTIIDRAGRWSDNLIAEGR